MSVARDCGFSPHPGRALKSWKETSPLRVDFVAERVIGWRWMLYQWALTEDVTAFARQMEPPPSTRAELASRLERDFGLRLPEVHLAKLGGG